MEDNMTTLHHLKYKEIYLFNTEQGSYSPNTLKCFIYYLRSQGKKGILDFAFSSSDASIHAKLSIKDNLILESVTAGLIRNSDSNLIEKIDNLENEYLAQLIRTLGPLDTIVSDLNKAGIKITSIVKSLLATTEFIFFEKPDESLNSEQIDLVKKCLEFESDKNGRKIFIKAVNPEVWLDIVTDIIEPDSENQYSKVKNPFYGTKKNSNFSHPKQRQNFIKKAG